MLKGSMKTMALKPVNKGSSVLGNQYTDKDISIFSNSAGNLRLILSYDGSS